MEDIINKLVSRVIDTEITPEAKNELKASFLRYMSSQYNKFEFSKNILYRNEPVNFYRNYISITIANKNYRTKFENPEEVFEKYSNIVLTGYAGSGKTSFLKYVFLACVNNVYKVPLYLELRKFSTNETIESFISSQINAEDINAVLRSFATGNIVFIFDGFDEVETDFSSFLLAELERFSMKYENNNFLISTRPGASVENLNGFSSFNVLPLNYNDILLFVEKINIERDLKRRIYESINKNSFIAHLVTNPLLLSLFILQLNYRGDIPEKRSIFFSNIIDHLLSNHDAITKPGFIREKMSELNREQIEDVLSSLAFRFYFSGKSQFAKDELLYELEAIKRVIKYKFDSQKLIYDLVLVINIMVQDGSFYSFAHISFVEYLAARFVHLLSYDNRRSFFEKIVSSSNVYLNYDFLLIYSELDRVNLDQLYVVPVLKIIYDVVNSKPSKESVEEILFSAQNVLQSDQSFILKGSKSIDLLRFLDIINDRIFSQFVVINNYDEDRDSSPSSHQQYPYLKIDELASFLLSRIGEAIKDFEKKNKSKETEMLGGFFDLL